MDNTETSPDIPDIFSKLSKDADFAKLMEEMKKRDLARIKSTCLQGEEGLGFKPLIYSSVPADKIDYLRPWLEPRVGYCTPVRYYQDLNINGEKQSMYWRHDCMRGIWLDAQSKSLHFFEKHVTEKEDSFFTFIYIEFAQGEYTVSKEAGAPVTVSVEKNKELANLCSGSREKIKIEFNFIHHKIAHTSPIHATSTAMYKNVYRGGGIVQAGSSMSKYVIPSSHFTVHPYLLNLHKKYGFDEPEDLEKKVNGYVSEIF